MARKRKRVVAVSSPAEPKVVADKRPRQNDTVKLDERQRVVAVSSPAEPKVIADKRPRQNDTVKLDERQRAFNHKEVECRIAAIQAIRVVEIDSLLSQLRLIRSYFNKEQLETSALQFFEENLSNLYVIRNEKDKIFELKRRKTERHGGGKNVRASLDSAATSLGVGDLRMSMDSVRSDFFHAANLHIPDFVPDEPSEYQMLGMQDAFQTPGFLQETSSRLSFGTTPKTVRLPKYGEMLLSVRGSPLGVYKEENLEAIHESGDGTHEGDS